MAWKEFLLDPVFKWVFAVVGVGAVVLVAIQMWRGDALVCSNGSIFARSCFPEALPTGAVLAFDREYGCPPGWEEHRDAAGRFILGSGRHSEYNVYGNSVVEKRVGNTGGEDQVRLEIQHMPSHSHQTPSRGDGSNEGVWALQATGRGEYGGRHGRPTDDTGDNQPHETCLRTSCFTCVRTAEMDQLICGGRAPLSVLMVQLRAGERGGGEPVVKTAEEVT